MDLENNRFFAAFSAEGRRKLKALAARHAYPRGSSVFSENDPADSVYLILSGSIELTKRDRDQTVVIARLGPGDYFGEMGVIDRRGRSAGARTAGETALVRLAAEPLREIILAEPSAVALALFHHISEHLRSANALLLETVVRKEKLEVVGEMAASIIHDLKNPMTSIQIAADLLAEKHADRESVEMTRIILRQVGRMAGMVNELLDYSRGRPALTLEPLSIRDLFSELEQLNAGYLRLRGIACSFSLIDGSINADRDRLLRTLQNLLNNAVESFGDQKGKIAFSARIADAKTLEIRVADNGPGIPEAIRDRLFEPFVTAGKKGGTGLGLAIAQTVIEAHSGSISCSSRAGGGAAFTILLPRL